MNLIKGLEDPRYMLLYYIFSGDEVPKDRLLSQYIKESAQWGIPKFGRFMEIYLTPPPPPHYGVTTLLFLSYSRLEVCMQGWFGLSLDQRHKSHKRAHTCTFNFIDLCRFIYFLTSAINCSTLHCGTLNEKKKTVC